MGDYAFNAPQYIDFTSPTALELKEFGDDYFDMDHEIEVEYQEFNGENKNQSPDSTQNGETCFLSFIENTEISSAQSETKEEPQHALRRSVSANHIPIVDRTEYEQYCHDEKISQALESLQLTGKKKKPLKAVHPNPMPARSRVTTYTHPTEKPKLPIKPRSVSRDGLNRLTSYTSDKLKRKGSTDNLQPNKYISLAEAVRKFQCGTPQRFHSKKPDSQLQHLKSNSLTQTIPCSPMLSTKNRSRPTTYVSRDEMENKEAEEMRKHPIKAQPVNYKILRAPVLNVKVEKKPSTQIQPFKFTEVKFQQKETPQVDLYEFHARPAPKSTAPANRPVVRRSIVPPTVAHTPTFMRKMKAEKIATLRENPNNHKVTVKTVDLHYDGVPPATTTSQKPSRTKPEPFSFEERDKRMQQRKEEKIQKLLEEEKKMREFHAKPIPKAIAGATKMIESKIKMGSNGSISSKNDENVEPNTDKNFFKARPATVIHKKPFVPKKEERPLLEFDEKIKQIEQEEIVKIRKETVHKANPVKHYKAVDILPSLKKITSPQSPMITKSRRHTQAL
ncbi:hypothetical protein CBL_11263 [Carabus blaptoides fortunei]